MVIVLENAFFKVKSDFAKNGYFPKNHFILLTRANIYYNYKKNVNFEILANIPPFLRNELFLGLGNPVQESGISDFLRSVKILRIDFSSQKTLRAKFLGHFDF